MQHLGPIPSVLVQTVRDTLTDDVPQWAAAVAFYAMLSAFPLLIAIVAIAGWFVRPEGVANRIGALLSDAMPQGQATILRVVKGAMSAPTSTSLISIVGFILAGSRVFRILIKALYIVYDIDRPAGFVRALLIEIWMMLTLGVLLVVALASASIVDLLAFALRLPPGMREAASIFQRWVFTPGLLLLYFFLLYRYVPRKRSTSAGALVGAVVATGLFAASRPVFRLYLMTFAHYNVIYGSLAIIMGLLMWAWVVALIALVGGELSSHVQMMLQEGKSAEKVGQMHAQRAPGRRTEPGSARAA